MSGHTKGPWAVEDPMDHCLTIVANPDAPVYDWKWVATCDWPTEDDHDITSAEVKANARLIAAAPDLLESLIEARLTLSITRTNIMVEMKKSEGSAWRWERVPEILAKNIAQCDAAIARARGES